MKSYFTQMSTRFGISNVFITDIDCDKNSIKSIKEINAFLNSSFKVESNLKQRMITLQYQNEEWENEGGRTII